MTEPLVTDPVAPADHPPSPRSRRRLAVATGLIALVLVVVLVTVLGGDDGGDPTAPHDTTTGATTTDPTGRTTTTTVTLPPPARTVEGDLTGARVRLEVQRLVRSGATTVLTARLTVLDTVDDPLTLGDAFTARGQGNRRFDLSDVLLFAPGQGLLGAPAASAAGVPATSSLSGAPALARGDSAGLRVVFGALPPDVRSADVLWPLLGTIPGLPVGDGDVPELVPYGDSPARDVELTGVTGQVQPVTARSSELEGAVRTEQAPDRTKVVLAADVLFALDSADLSDQSKAALDRAAAQIQAAGPGPVRVTGHTDDQGTDAYNLDLSNRRAQAVAAALAPQLPPAQFPLRVEGRGESEPAVPGTTPEARAANRRVELFVERAQKAEPAPASTALPPGGGPAATGATGLVFDQSDGGQLRLRAERAVRQGAWLRVDLAATVERAGTRGTTGFLVDLRDVTRRSQRADASGVGVLDSAVLRLPALGPDGTCACANTLFGLSALNGEARRFAVWVEAPAALGPTVVVQLPLGQGRLLDVPVED